MEQKLAAQKKKNDVLQQQATVCLDAEQVSYVLDSLTKCVEQSTNRVVEELPRAITDNSSQAQRKSFDGFAWMLKISISTLFIAAAIVIGTFLIKVCPEYWAAGWNSRFALFVLIVMVFDCLMLGIEAIRERDRNYIVSLFSALVALAALVVAFVK